MSVFAEPFAVLRQALKGHRTVFTHNGPVVIQEDLGTFYAALDLIEQQATELEERYKRQLIAGLELTLDLIDAEFIYWQDFPKELRDRLRAALSAREEPNRVLTDVADDQALAAMGAPVRCCPEWPECSHMLAFIEARENTQ